MKEIKGLEGYFVDELGNVFSKTFHPSKNKNRELRQLKFGINRGGYHYVIFCINGKQYTKNVHRLVAQSFIHNPNNKPCVNHKNGIKTDNRVENLGWCTQSENMKHSYDTGLSVAVPSKGIKNGQSKLTEAQVLQIRADSRKQKLIAIDYSVSEALISLIKKRINWKHI